MSPRVGEVSASTRIALPAGESLVARVQYPDGRVEEFAPLVYGMRSDRRRYVSQTLRWHLPGLSSNQTHAIVTLWRDQVEGNAFPLSRELFEPVFKATNQAGGVLIASMGLRWNPEVTDPARPPLLLKLTVAQSLSGMILTSLRWDGPAGCLPEGVGLLDGVEEVETHTTLHGSGGVSDGCRWNLPLLFGDTEAREIVRQLRLLVDSGSRMPLPTGGRLPVFSVTNSVGHVFSGLFILPWDQKGTP